ncbi:MAG: PAS domain S-box protein [Nitrospinae bacterium]|nr:PAS domain S-box protein [Nitrospinota bacterium]
MVVFNKHGAAAILAVSIIGVLAATAFLGLTQVIKTYETSAAVINISGRQRMFSQRVATLALRIVSMEDGAERDNLRAELLSTAEALHAAHLWLAGAAGPDLPGELPPAVHAIFFAPPANLDARILAFIDSARRLAREPDAPSTRARLELIVGETDGPVLSSLEAVVAEFQSDSERQVMTLRRMAGGALALILLALIVVAWFIFRPLTRRVSSEARALAESERRIREITATLGEGVIVADAQGRFTFLNPEAERLLGWREDELLGAAVHESIHSRKPDGTPHATDECPLTLTLRRGEVFRMPEDFFIRKNGEMIPVALVTTPLEGGRGAVAAFHDITAQKRAEEDLRRAKETAEEATRLKDKFVSLVAHDLRSPFNSIVGSLRALLSGEGSNPLSPAQKELARRSLTSSENLLTMIDHLLDISKLQSGKITPRAVPFPARVLAENALSEVEMSARRKGITLVNDVPKGALLLADQGLFTEVIRNLVSNAVKFCPSGAMVRVFVPEGKSNTMAVADTGPGVGPELCRDLFLHEIKTTTTGTAGERGAGLGLPLSYDIMKAHGGTLRVKSQKGKGCVFYAELPESAAAVSQ